MENVWRKNISEARDRIQSRILVCVVSPLLVLLCLHGLTFGPAGGRAGIFNSLLALGISVAFALLAWKLGSATPGAAASGGAICLLLVQVGEAWLCDPGCCRWWRCSS